MRVIKRLTLFIIIIQFLYGCTAARKNNYSYKVGTYTVDSVKQFIYSHDLISYGDYLFEFKDRVNINTIRHGDSESISILFDTIGVYLLSNENKLYYEFDTFSLKNEIVKIGRLADKQFGFKFNFPDRDTVSDVSFSPPKKKIINNINCFVTQIVPIYKTENDSMNVEMVLIKDKTFNSLDKMNGVKFTDSNYCIVGLHIFFLKQNQSFLQDIESMRPLTKTENNICANMIRKSKLCITDTIKSYSK